MKKLSLAAVLAAFAIIGCNDASTNNEKSGADSTTASKDTSTSVANTASEPLPDSATMMKNWDEYMAPGAVHSALAKMNGTWDSEVKMWMAPGAAPSVTKGTTTSKMTLGGRYQMSTHKGSYNGMPMEGTNIMAYDNHKKVVESVWIDNFGTGVMHLQGPWDEATKTITLKGKMMDPTTKKEVDVRETMKIIDDNTQTMEMFMMMDGKEFKTMEIKYTRKK